LSLTASRTCSRSDWEKVTIRDAAGRALLELGERDERVVVLTADVARSTRTSWFGERFPERFVNIGISEQDMAGFAAGLALAGKKPYMAAFAMFIMRAWEQIRNSIDRMRLDVKILATHSGFSDHGDGASHQSLEDIALMRVLHNMTVVIPADAPQAYNAILALHESVEGPVYFRLGRDYSPLVTDPGDSFTLGKIQVLVDGGDIALVSAGPILGQVIEAARILEREWGVKATVVNLHTVKPLDVEGLARIASSHERIIVVEEHFPRGGIYGAVAEALASTRPARVDVIAAVGYGRSARSVLDLYRIHGLDSKSLARRIVGIIGEKTRLPPRGGS